MKTKNETLEVERLRQVASDIGDVMEIIELINNLIDFTPAVTEEKVQLNPSYYYGKTKEVLTNLFYINQGLDKKLGNVASDLYSMIEEIKEVK